MYLFPEITDGNLTKLIGEYVTYSGNVVKSILDISNNKNTIYIYNLDNIGQYFIYYFDNNNIEYDISMNEENAIFKIKINNTIILDGSKIITTDISDADTYFSLMHSIRNMSNEKSTISQIAYSEWRKTLKTYSYNEFKMKCPVLDKDIDLFVRKTYLSGWCYKNVDKANSGKVYDINSLYPFVMHSKSNNYYPIGKPILCVGKWDKLYDKKWYYKFIHITAKFDLKNGFLPCIKNTNSLYYNPHKWLKTSQVKGKDIPCELWLTETDYEMLHRYYDVREENIIECYIFRAVKGMFDDYIDKWYDLKKNAKNENERTIAKFMLNSLGGRFGLKPFYYEQKNNRLRKIERDTIYCPIAAAMTAYGRKEIVSKAQICKDFYYSDTDSLHCKDTFSTSDKLGDFKLESEFIEAEYYGQKQYIERNIDGSFSIKMAGLSKSIIRNVEKSIKDIKDLKNKEIDNEITTFENGKIVKKNVKYKVGV